MEKPKELEQTYLSIERLLKKPFTTYKERCSEGAFIDLVEYVRFLRTELERARQKVENMHDLVERTKSHAARTADEWNIMYQANEKLKEQVKKMKEEKR